MTVSTTHGPRAIPDADYYEVQEEFNVASWSPHPVPGHWPATQVHLRFGAPPGTCLLVRFKSPRSLSALIDALIEHRAETFPGVCDACGGRGTQGLMRCLECAGKGSR